MAKARFFFLSFLLFSLSLHINVYAESPPYQHSSQSQSPSPSPESPADSPPSQADSPSPSLADSLSPSPAYSPSLSPYPSFAAPNSAPASSPLGFSPPAPSPIDASFGLSPAPSPVDEYAVNLSGMDDRTEESSGGGMSGSKKAGMAIGIIVSVSVLMLAGMVCKKRQQNLRRARYNYAGELRRDIIL